MKDKVNQWLRCFIRILGMVFGIIGAVSVFFPFADVTRENIFVRVCILIGITIVVAISAFIWAAVIICKKDKMIYRKGATKIIFEYSDINDIISASSKKGTDGITIIVPINSSLKCNTSNILPGVFDRERINKNTIHRACLDYLH